MDNQYNLPPSLITAVKATVKSNPAAMVTVFDQDGLVRYVSPTVTPLFGYEPVEVLGRHYSEFFTTLDAAHVRLALIDAAINGTSVSIKRNVRRKPGDFRTMEGPARAFRVGPNRELYELAIGIPVDPED